MKKCRTTPKRMIVQLMIMFNNDIWYAYECARNERNHAQNKHEYDYWDVVMYELKLINPTCSRIDY